MSPYGDLTSWKFIGNSIELFPQNHRYGRMDERTDGTDSIGPFGFQPGTKKAGKRARSNKPPGKSCVEHFYGHFKEKINKILGAGFV